MYSIKIYQTATDDLQESYDWYEEQIQGLGDRFLKEFDVYLEIVRKNPFQFAVKFSERYRFALLDHFPFRIVYRIDESANCIYVISVLHTSRDPRRF